MQPFSFFFLVIRCGAGAGARGDFGSGSGSKFNCAARVGSGQTISGTGRVRASVLSPCRPLHRARALPAECTLRRLVRASAYYIERKL